MKHEEEHFQEGVVYLAEKDGTSWTITPRLRSSTPEAYGWYGAYIAAKSNALVIGAPGWDFTANDWYATANGPGPATIDIPLRTNRWIGAYLYDYATAAYQEGKHLYLDSTLD